MTRRRKVLLTLATLVVLAGAYTVYLWTDDAPPDDADLRLPPRVELAAGENALTLLRQATDALDLPGDKPYLPVPDVPPPVPANVPQDEIDQPTEASRCADLLRDHVWDEAMAAEVLRRNKKALDLWEQSLAVPRLQIPLNHPFKDTGKYVLPVLTLKDVVVLRSRAAMRQGNHAAALTDGLSLVRSGRALESGEGDLVDYLVGNTIRGVGCDVVRKAMTGNTLTSAQVRACERQLRAIPPDAEEFRYALRTAYWTDCFGVEHLANEKFEGQRGSTNPVAYLGRQKLTAQWSIASKFLFKPNRLRAELAARHRQAVAVSDKTWKEAEPLFPGPLESHPVRDTLTGNFLRACLIEFLQMQPPIEHQRQIECDFAATRILLAMKAYKLDKGRLPDTLGQLVPEYLDAVPLDTFDGQPMRYNAAKKVVYSVGKDLKDDGGMTSAELIEANLRKKGIDPAAATPQEREAAAYEADFWSTGSFPIEF